MRWLAADHSITLHKCLDVNGKWSEFPPFGEAHPGAHLQVGVLANQHKVGIGLEQFLKDFSTNALFTRINAPQVDVPGLSVVKIKECLDTAVDIDQFAILFVLVSGIQPD